MHRAINVDKKEFEKINFELASKNYLETYLSFINDETHETC